MGRRSAPKRGGERLAAVIWYSDLRDFTRYTETLTQEATRKQVDYMLLNTSMPLDFALFRFLSMRERFARSR